MVFFHPEQQPQVLLKRERAAERAVWRALEQLTGRWNAFYSVRDPKRKSGAREADYVLMHDGALFFIEVKGGRIEIDSPAQAGVTWAQWSGEDEAVSLVEPWQLWRTTDQILGALEQSLGQSPVALGFRYCQIFIFPNTRRSEIPYRDDLDAPNQRFFFMEDMDDLAAKIETILQEPFLAAAQPATYWIIELRKTLQTYVLRRGFGDARWLLAKARQNLLSSPEMAQPAAYRFGTDASGPSQYLLSKEPPRRLDRIWRGLFPWICVGGVFLAYLLWPNDEPAKAVQPKKPAQTSTAVKPPESRPAPSAPKSAAVTVAERPESALPAFIPKVALTDVEQAVMLARQKNESVPWQTGKHHGFVTLYDVEDGRCLRHRITRNDVTPIEVGFTRRC